MTDCVISLSKMKTHALERITGAVKNSYGFIYGKNQAIGHTQISKCRQLCAYADRSESICEDRGFILWMRITAMEGNGPGSGDPIAMNVILMSTDPVALDSVFARLVYLKPEMVPTNYHGEKMGLGHCREENIEIVVAGAMHSKQPVSMEDSVCRDGKTGFQCGPYSDVRSNVWTKLAKALNIFQKKPYIEPEKCIRCGICVNSCPVPGKAVAFRKGKENPPVYDYKKCIRCFCCQEMCPKKAIKVK